MLEWFNHHLLQAVHNKASDVHFSSGSHVMHRKYGELEQLNDEVVTNEQIDAVLTALCKIENAKVKGKMADYDFSYEIPDVSRFRINIYRQRKGLSIAVRVIPYKVYDLHALGLPTALTEICQHKSGLFIVTGATGSGKSTTLASMINYLNKSHKKRIVTLEDPVEFYYENNKSIIEQRQVGRDVMSFDQGIRSALRQDPDIILVGELRDYETMSAAITAAETGHLVLSSLHTQNAPKSIDRIIDVFPENQQNQVRNQLATVLLGVISQQLITRTHHDGLALATELMVNNKAIGNLIRTGSTHQIHNTMQTDSGMHTMESKLQELARSGYIPSSATDFYNN